MKIKANNLFILCLILLLNNLTVRTQTIDDPLNNFYNGIWSYGGESPNLASIYATNPNLKGGFVKLSWDLLQPNDSINYNWNYFNNAVSNTTSLGLQAGITIFVGPNSPNWIYNVAPTVVTTNTVTFPFYPYYFDSDYQRLYFKMLRKVASHISTLPSSIRNKIIYIESCESKTGDPNPYDGNPVNNTYYISPAAWLNFRNRCFDSLYANFGNLTPPIHLLLNQGNTSTTSVTEDAYIDNAYPNAWRKVADVGDGYQLNDEPILLNYLNNNINVSNSSCLTNARSAGENDVSNAPFYAQKPSMHFYWHALYNLYFGNDMWKLTSTVFASSSYYTEGMNLYTKYAGQKDPSCATGAFCALKDGLDASDFTRFSVTAYGNGTETNFTARALSIVASYTGQGASQGDVAAANGQANNQKAANAINDVGWNINFGNYSRYLTQWSPNTTSIGYWQQGDTTQPYGRFARGFNHSLGMDTMFFDIEDNLFNTFPNNANTTVTINVTYLDKGTSKWKLMYDGKNSTTSLSQTMTAYTMTNTNTTNTFPITNVSRNQNYVWKTKSVIIANGMFGNNLPHGTDLMLVNKDNTDEIFHMIEIVKPASITTGLKSYEHKKIDDYLLYPNPTNGDLNISSNKIISGKLYEINIKNLLGQLVYTNNFIGDNNLLNVNCNHLLNGIYLVELKLEDSSVIKKIIKQ